MSTIEISGLNFSYPDGKIIFKNCNLSLNSRWKLGVVGKNGTGKTTLLKILCKKLNYEGNINTNVDLKYFPYEINERESQLNCIDLMCKKNPSAEKWQIACEMEHLGIGNEDACREFGKLSSGEQMKVMLSALFASENTFILIDEPTNHLDRKTRELVGNYLKSKQGFIVVSHDRNFLNDTVDHILAIEKNSIYVQSGNFSSWYENKKRSDNFTIRQNEKYNKEIKHLKNIARKKEIWAEKNENTKIGFDPIREPDRCKDTRGFIGAKTKKLNSQKKNFEKRLQFQIDKKESLINNVESLDDLKLYPLFYKHGSVLTLKNFTIKNALSEKQLFNEIDLQVNSGDRVFITGENGCGKTTLIKSIINSRKISGAGIYINQGLLKIPSDVIISYVSQKADIKGSIFKLQKDNNLNASLMFAMLDKLGVSREDFTKNAEEMSDGQRKKIMIASSLLTPAHIYIWDEPYNYLDIYTRAQIEEMILEYKPTMLIVEHDKDMENRIATKCIAL